MAKKKKRWSKPKFKIPLLTVAGFVPGITAMKRKYDDSEWDPNSKWNTVGIEAGRIFLGFDGRVGANPKWKAEWLWYGTFPIILGVVASKIAGRLGANRILARTGLPIRL